MNTTTLEVVRGRTVQEDPLDEELEVQQNLDRDDSDTPELSIEELEEFFRG
jgi:hypothetical protein